MKLIFTRISLTITLLALLLFPLSLHAEPSKFISLTELKPGMKGTAYSVFQGTEPEAFSVELQSIVDGPVAGSRYMLLRVRDEKLRIGSGFSGSPVYFDGRLAGAISHMENNLTSQIAMAVPIDRMLDDAARSAPASVEKVAPATELKPGSMISLPQVRGDFWMGSSGTVTYIDNGLLLAFGHENMFSGDSVQLPIHRATVHGIIPKLDISHKEASPLEEIGSVVWDGKSALVGRLGAKAVMFPFTVDYLGASGIRKHFNLEMINHTRLAPGITAQTIRYILSGLVNSSPKGADIDVILTIAIKGLDAPVVINQRLSAESLKSELSSTPNPLQSLLTALMFPVGQYQSLSSIAITMTELPDVKAGRIAEAAFTRIRARAGDTVNLRVRLNGPFGEPKDISVPVTIPAGYDQPKFTVQVQAGRSVRPSEATPGTVEEIAGWLSAIARSDELVVLSPGSVNGSVYPEARLNRTITRIGWNVEAGSSEASIAVVGGE
jgi:hypothetical protein